MIVTLETLEVVPLITKLAEEVPVPKLLIRIPNRAIVLAAIAVLLSAHVVTAPVA